MKVQQFLEHHGILENPFNQEDAQSDHVFQRHCLDGTRHPAWDKLFGSPESPSTSVVFGEKGSGKTALRLQLVESLKLYNQKNPERRTYIIEYDDFNALLDNFREHLGGRKRRPERALKNWGLWDHMDAILSLGTTRLVEALLNPNKHEENGTPAISSDHVANLSRLKKRDLLLLAAFYDHTSDMPGGQRWRQLARRLKFSTWQSEWDRVLGVVVLVATVASTLYFGAPADLLRWWVLAIIAAGWLPWLVRQARLLWLSWRVSRQIRVQDHQPNALRSILARFRRSELAGQPIPSRDRSDDRYELLMKLQSLLAEFGYKSITVLVDRVDEPHLVNGAADRMRDLLWPMFDNKFLKHPGIGFKLLLPSEVSYYLNREKKEFYERSRLDKQNLISSLEWTGESLYDVANDRIAACARETENSPVLRNLFDESVSDEELIGICNRMRVPRHLFKFLYRLLVEHCSRYTQEKPSWRINRETLQPTLALFMRDLEAFDRGVGTG